MLKLIPACILALLWLPIQVSAQPMTAQYVAYIGQADLVNSNGVRLTAPWQVLRQDRANYHRFGISQPGDQWDPFFDDAADRAMMEAMVMNGYISPVAAADIMRGGATVVVSVFASVQAGQHVTVEVHR
jgi:hypothetical protein